MSKRSSELNSSSNASSAPVDTHVSKLQAAGSMQPVVSAAAYYGLEQILPRTVGIPNDLADLETPADSSSV